MLKRYKFHSSHGVNGHIFAESFREAKKTISNVVFYPGRMTSVNFEGEEIICFPSVTIEKKPIQGIT